MSAQEHGSSERVPLPLLLAAAGLIVATLILVMVSRSAGIIESGPSSKEAVAEQVLRFEDRPNGSIAVFAGRDGPLIDVMGPGTNGFLRGTLRALVRERRLKGVTDRAPFRLVQGADGSLILHDPSTDRRLDLRAFGPTNARAFAGLLPSGSNER